MPSLSEMQDRHLALASRRTDRNDFQRQARLLQAMWRHDRGLAPAGGDATWRGSRLPLTEARELGLNFLTPAAFDAARRLVADSRAGGGQMVQGARLWSNLLSSQPLCINLFAELSEDLDLATRFLAGRLGPGRVARVTEVRFEWSPGRRDPRFLGDGTAFDAFFVYDRADGGRGFVGIEVKYHEDLKVAGAEYKERYGELSDALGWFLPEATPVLRRPPLEQIWRDHLLAGALLDAGEFDEGLYVVLFPAGNRACARVIEDYERTLDDCDTLGVWSLEGVVADLRRAGAGGWIDAFYDRYLAFERIEDATGEYDVVRLEALRRLLDDRSGAVIQDDGWTLSPVDPAHMLDVLPALHIRPEMRLIAYQFVEGANGNGFVYAVPAGIAPPPPQECTRRASGILGAPIPPGASPTPMHAVAGDGSDWSYLAASLLARELEEFGAMWHGSSWGFHSLTDGPGERPTVERADGEVLVTFHTYTEHDVARLVRHVDTYLEGRWVPHMSAETIREDGPGFIC